MMETENPTRPASEEVSPRTTEESSDIVVDEVSNDKTKANEGENSQTPTNMEIDEELDEIMDQLEGPQEVNVPAPPEVTTSNVQPKGKRRYCFDGGNRMRMSQERVAKMRSFIAKGSFLKEKLMRSVFSMRTAVREKATGVFSGSFGQYIPRTIPKIPPLIYYSIRDIERRDPVTRGWIYRTPVSNSHLYGVKRKFLRGKVPEVNK